MDKLFGKWVVPVRVYGAQDFKLLAIWACPVGTKRADNYIGQVHRCLVEQDGWFNRAPVVVAGDFNALVGLLVEQADDGVADADAVRDPVIAGEGGVDLTAEDWLNARKIINALDCAPQIADYGKRFYGAISYTTGE